MDEQERSRRSSVMRKLRVWLAGQGENQHWLADLLGLYHGYVNNLLTGKQIPSEETVKKAILLMDNKWAPKKPAKKTSKKVARKARKVVSKKSRSPRPEPTITRPIGPPRHLTAEEISAISVVMETLIKSKQNIRPGELADLTRAVVTGFTTRWGVD